MSDLEEAWNEVHEVLPAGWMVSHPVQRPGDGYWVSYARDPYPRKSKATPPLVEAVGRTEALALKELARGIRLMLDGEVAK